MARCKKCSADVAWARRRDSDRWLPPLDAEYDALEPAPGEVTVLWLDGDWREVDVRSIRVHRPHVCEAERRGTVRRRAAAEPVEEEDGPEPEAVPEPPLCDSCGDRHDPAQPCRTCDCGRYPVVGFGVCQICLDVLGPDPDRYPRGQLGSPCLSCGAEPQKPCMTKGGYPAAQPHASRPSPVFFTPMHQADPITRREIDDAMVTRRLDVKRLRDWLWDHHDLLDTDSKEGS